MKNISNPHFTAITISLTPKSLDWLNGSTCGVPHLTIYKDLLYSMATTECTDRKRGIDVPLKPLEVEASANSFSERWNMSRKVMTRLMTEMEQLGLIVRDANKLRSVLLMAAVVDCTPCKDTSSNQATDVSQAEQQNDAQPASDVKPDVSPSARTEAICVETPSAPKVTTELSSQAPDPSTDEATAHTSYISHAPQHTHDAGTLFDGVDELP